MIPKIQKLVLKRRWKYFPILHQLKSGSKLTSKGLRTFRFKKSKRIFDGFNFPIFASKKFCIRPLCKWSSSRRRFIQTYFIWESIKIHLTTFLFVWILLICLCWISHRFTCNTTCFLNTTKSGIFFVYFRSFLIPITFVNKYWMFVA